MEFDSESNGKIIKLEAEISETKELILKIKEKEEVMLQQVRIAEDEMRNIDAQIEQKQHFKREEWIKQLMEEINQLEKFHDMLHPPSNQQLQCIWTEQIRMLTFKLHHGKKDLAAERKKLREIQQLESEKEQHNHDSCNKQDVIRIITRMPYIPDFGRRVKVESNSEEFHPAYLGEWVERIKHVSELMIRDRSNSVASWESWRALHELSGLRQKMEYMVNNENREKVQRSWESMREVKNVVQHIRVRLGKMKQSSREDYAEFIRLEERRQLGSISLRSIRDKMRFDVWEPKQKAFRRLQKLEDRKQSMA